MSKPVEIKSFEMNSKVKSFLPYNNPGEEDEYHRSKMQIVVVFRLITCLFLLIRALIILPFLKKEEERVSMKESAKEASKFIVGFIKYWFKLMLFVILLILIIAVVVFVVIKIFTY